MENSDIAKVLGELADMMEIKGENPFRIRSYRFAVDVINGWPEDIAKLSIDDEADGGKRVEEIPGIGKGISEKIHEIAHTGTCKAFKEITKELPASLLQLLKVQGMGPKKAALVYRELGVKTLDDLDRAAKAGSLARLKGMGEKTEANILRAIQDLKAMGGRISQAAALVHASDIIAYLKKAPGIGECAYAGSLRRWKESIGDIDILATRTKKTPLTDIFAAYPGVKEVLGKGETKCTVILSDGVSADLRVVKKDEFGSALQYFTGSKLHNVALRGRAKRMGLKVNEYGVFMEADGERVAGETEEGVYESLGLRWIPPELRENTGEIEASAAGKLPKLVEESDIKGDLHLHTGSSDGSSTVEEMSRAAIERGYEYIAVTDHSRSAVYAGGLDETRLLRQLGEIDRVNERLERKGAGFRVLKGAEVDIRPDGSLDYPERVLKKLDCVVAAIHSSFNMSEKEMTARVVKALSTGLVDILAHPSGRLIGIRPAYHMDMEAVIETAAKHNAFMELNSCPERLDLSEAHLELAKASGVLVAISTDAHSPAQLGNIGFGIHAARRAWLEKKDALNALGLNDLLALLGRGR
jgi:DNA polymerase (family 10)